MLETVREYAGELLRPRTPAAPSAPRRYYAELAERIARARRAGPQATVDRIAQEHDNLRALLAYALDEDLEIGFATTAALRRYWEMAARGREIRRGSSRRFPSPPGPRPGPAPGRNSCSAGSSSTRASTPRQSCSTCRRRARRKPGQARPPSRSRSSPGSGLLPAIAEPLSAAEEAVRAARR